jgi:hypothetical protein
MELIAESKSEISLIFCKILSKILISLILKDKLLWGTGRSSIQLQEGIMDLGLAQLDLRLIVRVLDHHLTVEVPGEVKLEIRHILGDILDQLHHNQHRHQVPKSTLHMVLTKTPLQLHWKNHHWLLKAI